MEANAGAGPLEATRHEWLVIRQTTALPEELAVLEETAREAREQGRTLTVVLLGRAAYALPVPADRMVGRGADVRYVVLREDVDGRGIPLQEGAPVEKLEYRELIRRMFSAERVIQFG